MRLSVDLSALHAAVRRMDAEPVKFSLKSQAKPLNPIDLELEQGIELPDLSEVKTNNGLFSYQGRQVVVYIQDHHNSAKVREAIENGQKGNKFHLLDCRTIKEKKNDGTYNRYVAIVPNGDFYIVGKDWRTGELLEDYARLWVCQNCLKALNYQSAQRGRAFGIAKNFNIQEFFSTYSSFFSYLPQRWAGQGNQEDYTTDWPQVAARYKANKDFACESCSINLSAHKQLLHGHHRNGVKSDNRESNLMALCAACHRQQPHHGQLCVSHEDMQTINRLRREQGLLQNTGWSKTFEFCDPALKGVLDVCCHRGTNIPEVGFDVQDARDAVVANLELAWPEKKVGFAISDEDEAAAQKAGWRIWRMHEALENKEQFIAEIED